MANKEHLKILKQGVEQWNKWRLENTRLEKSPRTGLPISRDTIRPDLGDADLSDPDLSGADLSRANLSGAGLRRAKLGHASLSDAP